MEWIEIAGKIPSHMTCSINHNEHKNCYQNLKQYFEFLWNGKMPPPHQLSSEEYYRCIETDEFWEIRWYPLTPIRFYTIYAPTLPECFGKITLDYEEHNALD